MEYEFSSPSKRDFNVYDVRACSRITNSLIINDNSSLSWKEI